MCDYVEILLTRTQVCGYVRNPTRVNVSLNELRLLPEYLVDHDAFFVVITSANYLNNSLRNYFEIMEVFSVPIERIREIRRLSFDIDQV